MVLIYFVLRGNFAAYALLSYICIWLKRTVHENSLIIHVIFLLRKENFVKSYLIEHNFRTAQKGEIIVFFTKSMILHSSAYNK